MSRSFSALAVLTATAATLVPASSALAGQATYVQTSHSQSQYFVVPAGVSSIDFHLVGARGESVTPGATGGRGGFADGTLAVTPGHTLTGYVGIGGGAGGGMAVSPAGDGGAATELLDGGWISTQQHPPFMLIGGGGGGGGRGVFSGAGGDAGFPSATAGGDGTDGTASAHGLGGGPGTSSAMGAGGANAGAGSGGVGYTDGNGDAGGGTGGTGPDAYADNGGGGGGAGYFGGGGGGASDDPDGGAGGGGGGSDWASSSPRLTNVSLGTSNETEPSITFSYWDPIAPVLRSFDQPAQDNPTTFTGVAGTDTGDDRTVSLALIRSAAINHPALRTFTGTVSDDGTFRVDIPSAVLPDGFYTAALTQGDSGGNESDPLYRSFTVDHTPPAVDTISSLTSPSARPVLTALTGDDATGVTFTLTSQSGTAVSFDGTRDNTPVWRGAPSFDLPNGVYSVVVTATDAQGNKASTRAYQLTVAVPAQGTPTYPPATTTPPAVVTKPKLKVSVATRAAKHHRTTITVKVTATGAKASKVKVCLAGTPVGKKAKCWSLAASLAAGRSKTYTFTVKRAGKVKATATAPGATSATPATKAIKIR